jgi:hypothetical protein
LPLPTRATTNLGYGGSPVFFSAFFSDAAAVAGTTLAGASTTLSMQSWRWIGDAGYTSTCVPTNSVTYGGLIGLSPGGLTNGKGNSNDPTVVGGAACYPTPPNPNGDLVPCNNTPPMFQALMAANNLPNIMSLQLGPPSTQRALCLWGPPAWARARARARMCVRLNSCNPSHTLQSFAACHHPLTHPPTHR